jgi:hypothetical protein
MAACSGGLVSSADTAGDVGGKGWTGPVPEKTLEWTPLPWGVASPDGEVGYVASAQGGVEAFRVSDGTTLWHSEAGIHPLLALEDVVFAVRYVAGSTSAMRVVGIDAADGSLLFASRRLDLPEWVGERMEHACCENSSGPSRAACSNGVLTVVWRAASRCVGGVGVKSSHEGAWEIVVQLEDGSVSVSETHTDEPTSHFGSPAEPLVVGGVALYAEPAQTPEGHVNVLHARDLDSGEPTWTKRILTPAPMQVCPF